MDKTQYYEESPTAEGVRDLFGGDPPRGGKAKRKPGPKPSETIAKAEERALAILRGNPNCDKTWLVKTTGINKNVVACLRRYVGIYTTSADSSMAAAEQAAVAALRDDPRMAPSTLKERFGVYNNVVACLRRLAAQGREKPAACGWTHSEVWIPEEQGLVTEEVYFRDLIRYMRAQGIHKLRADAVDGSVEVERAATKFEFGADE